MPCSLQCQCCGVNNSSRPTSCSLVTGANTSTSSTNSFRSSPSPSSGLCTSYIDLVTDSRLPIKKRRVGPVMELYVDITQPVDLRVTSRTAQPVSPADSVTSFCVSDSLPLNLTVQPRTTPGVTSQSVYFYLPDTPEHSPPDVIRPRPLLLPLPENENEVSACLSTTDNNNTDNNNNNTNNNKETMLLSHAVLTPDEDGDIALHIAVAKGELSLVEHVLRVMSQLDTAPDYSNNHRQTALHLAVIMDRVDIICQLLTYCASPNMADRKGQTCLHLAVNNSTTTALQTLLHHSQHSLHLNSLTYDGLTCLHMATQRGRLDMVEQLLAAGADVNIRDGKNGRTALYFAAESNKLDIARVLLKHGARTDLATYTGCLPLQAAVARSHCQLITLLENAGLATVLHNNIQLTHCSKAKDKKLLVTCNNKLRNKKT